MLKYKTLTKVIENKGTQKIAVQVSKVEVGLEPELDPSGVTWNLDNVKIGNPPKVQVMLMSST